jgi:adenosine deaminase
VIQARLDLARGRRLLAIGCHADDIEIGVGGRARLGRLAHLVRDRRVPLELCPTSNVHSGAAGSIDEHPIGLLMDLKFRVTVNTDNRLMSATSLSQELAQLVVAFGIGWDRIARLTINAMKSAFIPFDERVEMLDRVIRPAYAKLTEP